jgi:hypothetical protein
MNRTGVLQEIRQMRFEAILGRHEAGALSQSEAAELPGISERSLHRWRAKPLRRPAACGRGWRLAHRRNHHRSGQLVSYENRPS